MDKSVDVDAVVMHIESTKGISEESMLIYKEVKIIKDKCKQEMDKKHAKIDTLNKEKKMVENVARLLFRRDARNQGA